MYNSNDRLPEAEYVTPPNIRLRDAHRITTRISGYAFTSERDRCKHSLNARQFKFQPRENTLGQSIFIDKLSESVALWLDFRLPLLR